MSEKLNCNGLKPCPFCGNKNVKVWSLNELFEYEVGEPHFDLTPPYIAFCSLDFDGCGVETVAHPTAEEAAVAWNRREVSDDGSYDVEREVD